MCRARIYRFRCHWPFPYRTTTSGTVRNKLKCLKDDPADLSKLAFNLGGRRRPRQLMSPSEILKWLAFSKHHFEFAWTFPRTAGIDYLVCIYSPGDLVPGLIGYEEVSRGPKYLINGCMVVDSVVIELTVLRDTVVVGRLRRDSLWGHLVLECWPLFSHVPFQLFSSLQNLVLFDIPGSSKTSGYSYRPAVPRSPSSWGRVLNSNPISFCVCKWVSVCALKSGQKVNEADDEPVWPFCCYIFRLVHLFCPLLSPKFDLVLLFKKKEKLAANWIYGLCVLGKWHHLRLDRFLIRNLPIRSFPRTTTTEPPSPHNQMLIHHCYCQRMSGG